MDESPGSREEPRPTTRRALEEAARRLFAEKGVEATTIRQISEAAHVTERTFYRYFDGKEGLIAGDAMRWVDVLGDAIRARPTEEAPYIAVRRALAEVAGRRQARWLAGGALGIFAGRADPRPLLPRATARPLVRFEEAVAAALLARDQGPLARSLPDADPRAAAELIARVAAAALRTAVIRHRHLQAESPDGSPGIPQLLDETFTLLTALTNPPR